RRVLLDGRAKLIETRPAPGETTYNLPPDLIRTPRGYRPKPRHERDTSPLLNLQGKRQRE
ncbi:MAG: hypothetical protein ACRCV5_08575, partial [Afipia sp.]